MSTADQARYVVAVDNGSQSTKVLILDQDGTVHASAQRRLRGYETPEPGHVVHPGDDVWESIVDACAEATASFRGDPAQLVGLGLCTIRFCRALLDADGRLAEPMLSWMDERVSRPHVQRPGVASVTTSSGYITHRLTGERRDAAANHQGVWPIDQATRRWSTDPAAYEATGLRPEQLFELVDPGELLGRVSAEAAGALGLPAGLPVFGTANDKAVEALGSGLRSDDQLLLSLGTYIAAMSTGPFAPSSDAYWVNFGSEPGRYLYESGGIRRGMWTVSWWRDLLAGGLTDEELNAGAALVPPGADGLIALLDWLAPGDAPDRRGALLGFDGRQGRFHVHRSILEGIAMTMRGHVDRMETALGRRFAEIVVSGGGSRSDLVMSIVADVFDRPARRMRVTDAAGTGAAICALVGAGVHPDFDTAVAATVSERDRVEPDPERAEEYRRLTARYAAVTTYTDPLFEHLAR
ncbi:MULTISPECIES: FGGY-family carbohydrate kinase [unclassified Rathayibacter]|uniref:FGGY-family carbohydrate kinase n=1 Tax=unclassified Rathayibacter TaxID=2609250 RepID=UPI000CE7E071|nr:MULTISPECIES: FGGY-family carbohydrate kinase [unclassified Rathayibacter]PPG02171.1 sugar kinase [Rathayibacter sp. AY2B1]PPG73936.1 sugar kinase [Rathayibacter sp. AY1F4]